MVGSDSLLQITLSELCRKVAALDRRLAVLRADIVALQLQQQALLASLQAVWDFITPEPDLPTSEEPVVEPLTAPHSITQTFLGSLNSLD